MSVFHVTVPNTQHQLIGTICRIFQRTLQERCQVMVEYVDGEADLILEIDARIGNEGYRITQRSNGTVIAGDDERGLLYGVGKYLRTSSYHDGQFISGNWQGQSVPDCSVRAAYFAYSFHNWYASATTDDVVRYIEELALWGVNTLALGIIALADTESAYARAEWERNRTILRAAKSVGMRIACLKSPNYLGYLPIPDVARSAPFPDTTPPSRGNGPHVCPSEPTGRALILDTYLREMEMFSEVGLDYFVAYPYDSGGCGCDQCWPWGARGFYDITQALMRQIRISYPACKCVFCTWCFDAVGPEEGEWAGIAQLLQQQPQWVDFILADSHEDFPRYPLEHGVPGGLPLVNFPEITMWGRFPWGGSGANPQPQRIQRHWDQAREVLNGGFPYSEGRFTDLNMVMCAGLYWRKDIQTDDIVREYVAYYFSPEAVAPVATAITLLERTYASETRQAEDVEKAYALMQQADAILSPAVRDSWRWRILYLRAVIDHELLLHSGQISDRCDAAYEELIRLYVAENADQPVAPTSRRFRLRRAQLEQLESTLPGAR